MLGLLLAEELRGDGRILVSTAHMGRTESYVGTASLRWINNRVGLASQMPLLRNKIDEGGRLVIDQETVEEMRQRAPDWSRQALLAHYLIKNPTRKFPPLLVVVTESWVMNRAAPEWGPDGRAVRTSARVEWLDQERRVGVLDFADGVEAYAADGQHRLIGIQGVLLLIQTGQLPLKAVSGKPAPRSEIESADELLADYGLTDAQLRALQHETIGVEFIPAVIEGETYEEARRRVRSIFVHVNKTAKPLTQGELAVLDEDDGFAIVARRVAVTHPVLRRNERGDRVNFKSTALPAGGIWLTSLATIQDMAVNYLAHDPDPVAKYGSWRPKRKAEIPVRPDEEQLARGEGRLCELWDSIGTLPSFRAIASGESIDKWREFPSKGGRGHLLMRPLGQLILADAVGWLHLGPQGPRLSLEDIFDKLRSYDDDGGFEAPKRENPWYGVTFDPVRERMVITDREVAVLMLEYLVAGDTDEFTPEMEARLIEGFRKRRTFLDKDGESVYLDADGTSTDDPQDVRLPQLI